MGFVRSVIRKQFTRPVLAVVPKLLRKFYPFLPFTPSQINQSVNDKFTILNIEAPQDNIPIVNNLTVRGRAFSTGAPLTRIDASLGRFALGALSLEETNQEGFLPQLRVFRRKRGHYYIYEGTFDLAQIKPGSYELVLIATDKANQTWEQRKTVSVSSSEIIFNLDTPAENTVLAGLISIAGWTFSTKTQVTGVEAFIEGTSFRLNAINLARPDVAEAYPNIPFALNSGFENTFSLAGIPSGKYDLVVQVTDTALNNQEFSRSIEVEATDIDLAIDTPAENSILTGIVAVAGWATSPTGSIEKIEVFLDEEFRGALKYHQPRIDVARAKDWQCEVNCGFSGKIDLTDITSNGFKNLSVRATDLNGIQVQKTLVVEVIPSIIRFNLDSPVAGDTTSGFITVHGWAFDKVAAIEKVEAFLNNEYIGRVQYGLLRQDLKSVYPNLSEYNLGFAGTLEFRPVSTGLQVLTVRVTDFKGNRLEQEVEIQVAWEDQSLAQLEKATWRDNLLELEGWAIFPGNPTLVTARVFLDETFLCEKRVNLSRPDIWHRFKKSWQSYCSGFRIKQAVMAEEGEKTGVTPLHALTVEFSDNKGNQFSCKTHLKHEPGTNRSLAIEPWNEIITEYKLRYAVEPTILDLAPGLNLAKLFPNQVIFSPLEWEPGAELPYFDKSVDLVVIASTENTLLEEARRVCAKGLIFANAHAEMTPSAGSNGIISFYVEWLDNWQNPLARLPGCTIIIPTFNGAELTHNCLNQLLPTLPDYLDVEVLVMDDASSDNTPELAQQWLSMDKRVRFHQNTQNLGFLLNSNLGAELATKEVIVFLNNDTLPQAGWLEPLLRTLKEHPEAGAVGGKLIYPDGQLQEAGGIIFSDGEGWNFGRYDYRVNAPVYNYLREVDYCSGALLATWRNLFLEAGGFDEYFVPMYYEDVDYCFTLRKNGKKVYYQPESVIIHLEGGTAGTDTSKSFKTYQVINHNKFIEKWGIELKHQPHHPDKLDFKTTLDLVVRSDRGNEKTVISPL